MTIHHVRKPGKQDCSHNPFRRGIAERQRGVHLGRTLILLLGTERGRRQIPGSGRHPVDQGRGILTHPTGHKLGEGRMTAVHELKRLRRQHDALTLPGDRMHRLERDVAAGAQADAHRELLALDRVVLMQPVSVSRPMARVRTCGTSGASAMPG
jgi:hypothetical protein